MQIISHNLQFVPCTQHVSDSSNLSSSYFFSFQGDYIWIEPVSKREFDVAIGARVVSAEGRKIQVLYKTLVNVSFASYKYVITVVISDTYYPPLICSCKQIKAKHPSIFKFCLQRKSEQQGTKVNQLFSKLEF